MRQQASSAPLERKFAALSGVYKHSAPPELGPLPSVFCFLPSAFCFLLSDLWSLFPFISGGDNLGGFKGEVFINSLEKET
jgi:hypothetical protein